jgi:hypothetical protein
MFASTKSIHGNKCATLIINDVDFSRFYPHKRKNQAPEALSQFFEDVGVPSHIHTDGAKELCLGEWKRVREQQGGVKQTIVEPYSPWQNRAESGIKENKKQIIRKLNVRNAPRRLWDYCGVWTSEIRSLTAGSNPSLNGRTPYEIVTGQTPNITEWLLFDWYEPVWYYDNPDGFPADVKKLGRWLGVAHRVGQALCFWILPITGCPIARSTVQSVTGDEYGTDDFKKKLSDYDKEIHEKLSGDNEIEGINPMEFLEDTDAAPEPFEEEAAMPEADEYTEESLDEYLTAQVILPQGDEMRKATVVSRKRDASGNPMGLANTNPILDTRVYTVEFPDGVAQEYSANVIAESIYSQVDNEGQEFLMLDEIVDHRSDDSAVRTENMWIQRGSNQRMRQTTKGWQLLVQWKDGSTTWTHLKDLKESNPVQVSEYAVANQISDEPGFAWWVKDVLRRRDRIISKVKSRYWLRTHKFGIELPKSTDEALQIDKDTGTDFWKKALEKEMKGTKPAFKILDDDEAVPVAHEEIRCHMVFDIKMDFQRKARIVAGGHMLDTPASMTYSSVVSRESVRIAFTVAALNDLDVLAADVGNAYLNAEVREKCWFKAGSEFGIHKGKRIVIVRALYGLKSSGAAWRAHMAQTMTDLGFTPCQADPDVWMKKAVKPCGFAYWEYVLIYVDDILAISHNPSAIMDRLSALYRLKEDPTTGKGYGKPKMYLGAEIGTYRITGADKDYWFMSSDKYVGSAVKTVETELEKTNRKLSTKVETPMANGYRPELDVSQELDDRQTNYYQNLIGVLRWAVELGRIDIHVEIAMLSSYLAAPRSGHMEQVLHVFAYLKKYGRSKMVFDDSVIDWKDKFKKVDWTDFYPDAHEPLPPNAPEPRGLEVQLNTFVDADHAGNRVTRRSHTGVLIFLNKAPILWFSKKQNTVESSTFGSEFVAMRQAVDLIQGLRYKLRMMGIPIDGPANVFCDNQAVVQNTTMPESTLKKKHVAICYHRVREACAGEWIRITKEHTDHNLSDLLTKPLSGPKLRWLIQRILY